LSFRGAINGPARSGRPDDKLRRELGIHNLYRCMPCSTSGYGFRTCRMRGNPE
jgi:hypothetical protein